MTKYEAQLMKVATAGDYNVAQLDGFVKTAIKLGRQERAENILCLQLFELPVTEIYKLFSLCKAQEENHA